MYSAAVLSRRASPRLLLLLATGLLACSGARPAPRPPIFPPLAAWKTLLDDVIVEPLAAGGPRIFVATRDGAVRCLDRPTGSVLWKVDGFPGRLSATEGVLIVRDESGTLTSLHPRTGAVRWRTDTGVAGSLPALVDGDRVHVAGKGMASLLVETGAPVWVDGAGEQTTAPPTVAGSRLVTGEKDGTLRCRDRANGTSLWTLRTREALLAPPVVDEARGRLYLGTTDRQILEVSLDRGRPGWSWRVGADVAHAGLLQGKRVLFAPHDAVLYALATGGNLAWRRPLPSRPLSPPLAVDGHLLVACLENVIVAFDALTGLPAGSFNTPVEIRAAPVSVGDLLVLGMRDRSVIAYGLAGRTPLEGVPPEGTPPTAAPVEAPPAGH